MAETVSFYIKISDNGTFKKVEVDADSLRDAVRHVKEEADRLNHGVVNWAQLGESLSQLENGMSQLSGMVNDLSGAYAVQETAEQKLATNMRNTMGARGEDIQSIKDLCSAQQELGVIGDEVQLSGAQELATYLEKKSSLEKLIPVMNDMLAQQYGLEASQESAAQIATMLGKVMDGQVGALSRYGYKFDEAQEQILKFGTEEQRAAVLAEVVESAVGGMNAALAKTDSGQQKQLANRLGDIKEQLGGMVQSIAPLVTIASQLVIVAANAGKCVTTVKALAAAMHLAALKSTLLAAHARVQATAQTLLSGALKGSTVSTWALNAAVTALYATLTMGLSLIISGIVALFTSMGDEAEDAAEGVDILKESTDAMTNAVSNTKAEIDMEIVSLRNLINSHGNAAKKVEELNRKYGEALGYHRSAAEWYNTLVTKSKAYCMQLGYEAQAKTLASQIAAKEMEREALANQQFWGNQQYWDSKGKIHYNWEQMNGGKAAFDALAGKIALVDSQLVQLRNQYDTCTDRMTRARQEIEQQLATAALAGKDIEINSMTYDELNRAIEENNSSLQALAPSETAEIERLKGINQQLAERKKVLGQLLGLEKKEGKSRVNNATDGTGGIGTGGTGNKAVADPKTYTELGDAISAYEKRLKDTHPSEEETIRLLNAEIAKYKEKQTQIEKLWHESGRPAELNTLEAISAELQYQQKLRVRATAEDVKGIDREIARLNELKRAFEESSHEAMQPEQIQTYEQLENEISFYEGRLRHATEAERIAIRKRINALNEMREKWNETLDDLEVPEDITRLNSIEKLDKAISYYSARQKKASADEIESIQRTIDQLDAKRSALQRLTEIPSMQRELADLSGLSGKKLTLELELTGVEGIKGKIRSLRKMLGDLSVALPTQHAGREFKEIQQMIAAWEEYERRLKKSQASLREAWGGMKGVASGVESITEAINGEGNAWDRVAGVIDGALSIYDGLKSVIAIVEMLTAVSTAHAAAKTVEASAETAETATMTAGSAAAVTASAATAAVLGVETTAWSALSAAKTFAAHAYIPFVGTAIASGYVAAQQAVILAAAIPKFADGALAYGPTLGIFGEYAGAKSNPEVVAPLDKLKGLIGETGSMKGKVEFRIKGRYLRGVLQNENNHIRRS